MRVATAVDYQRVFEAALEPQLLVSASGEVVTVSDGYLRGLGLTRADVASRSVYELPPYSRSAQAERALRDVNARLLETTLPTSRLRFDGDAAGPALWPTATLWAVRDVEERLEHIVHIFESAAGSAERSESDSERRLRKLIEHSYEAVLLFDARGRVVYVSPTITCLLGYTPEEFAALDPIENIHPDDRAGFGEQLQRLLKTPGGKVLLRFRAQHRDGSYRRLESASVNRLDDADVSALVATVRDVTHLIDFEADKQRLVEERRQLELRAQESQKLESLGMLAGGIAHDFNNLLMVILGGMSLVRSEVGPAHSVLPQLGLMEEAAQRATDLCRQLLAYAGRGRFKLERTDLNELIEGTVHLLQLSINKRSLLRLQLGRELPAVVIDRTQMRQVLMNLVINASDAMADQHGTITIHTGLTHVQGPQLELPDTSLTAQIPAGDYVYAEVSDTGVGMTSEVRARIFEPFFTTKFTGRGLGLAAVLGIVRGHKGALRVKSEPGRGSSFTLLIPVEGGEAAGTADETGQEATLAAANGTILVVDDEPAVRSVACELVEAMGFKSLWAADGREAIRVYREHKPEIVCVLMDLTMPGLDGHEALEEMRRIDPELCVLLMSGYNEQEALGQIPSKAGETGFIQKPFTLGKLKQQLSVLLNRCES